MSAEDKNEGYLTEGWYRYTDIIFWWWKTVENMSDRSALRAFIHPSSLISDQCPLHPGKEGMELFMAPIHSGENRLCFSLKQISYIRYWLYAYGLTSTPLQLPSTHFLLTPEDLRGQPSPVTYKTESELKNADKEVKKHNKRVKAFAGDVKLFSLRTEFERHYDFGKTETLTKAEFKKRIGEMISKYADEGPLYLVFHDRRGDIEYLHRLEVPGIGNLAAIPNKPPGPGMYCVDTSDMFSALEGDSRQRRGLERVCLLLRIQGFAHPHNAGNDAHYTMEVLRAMASGKPLDAQREERWPNQTEVQFGQERGVKVEWTEADLDGDYH